MTPLTCTHPSTMVAWNSSSSILASLKMSTVYMIVTMNPDQFWTMNRLMMMNIGTRVCLLNTADK